MKKILLPVLAVSLLSGCSMTLPVQGDLSNGKEKFLGQATGYLDGSGKLILHTESNLECKGVFQYDDPRVSGAGTFICEDGRTGTFRFTSDGTSGMGFGKTNKGEPFRFTFGHNKITTEW